MPLQIQTFCFQQTFDASSQDIVDWKFKGFSEVIVINIFTELMMKNPY